MYEGQRAQAFAQLTGIADKTDPFFRHVLHAVTLSSIVLDVGAGSGRYALALAPLVKDVVAVDPSEDLLAILGRQAKGLGLTNVRSVLGRWEDVEPVEADVSVCYGVMGHVEDADPFFRKLDACTLGQVFVGIAAPIDIIRAPLWRHFHDEPPRPFPPISTRWRCSGSSGSLRRRASMSALQTRTLGWTRLSSRTGTCCGFRIRLR